MHWIALQASEGEKWAVEDAALADAGSALAWWALQFTPRVARLGAAVVLEVSGSDRLFGGRQGLLEQLELSSASMGPLRMAQGATSLLALAQLQIPATDFHGVDHLPLRTLPEAREHLPTLERLGCRQWGELRALPRGGVARRFGAALLDALDRAYGLKPETYEWVELPDVFDLSLELFAQVEAAPALMFAARRLLAQLRVWLQARQLGLLALELAWEMDARRKLDPHGRLLVRTAVPTRDMQHLQRLLAENLARVVLPAPVLGLRLRSVETAALPGRSDALLPDALQMGEGWPQLLERLGARLGAEQVLQVRRHADHRPERMQVWSSALADASSARAPAASARGRLARKPPAAARKMPAATLDTSLYPNWLLARPIKLAMHKDRPLYQGPLALLAGPQRLETAWWDVSTPHRLPPGKPLAALRDYFLARSEQAGLLWIYRERLTGAEQQAESGRSPTQWYLHGLFG